MPATSPALDRPLTPYDRIGGRAPIAAMVERFYDLMGSEPAFARLRALHQANLAPMREKLTDFLVAWMGGPRDWFDKNPGSCMMSAHAAIPGIDRETAEQWIACMTRAARNIVLADPDLAAAMLDSMASMCRAMARRAQFVAAA
ncbi:MAG TPA: group II truncated hemoglobin [Sphingobium sp.]